MNKALGSAIILSVLAVPASAVEVDDFQLPTTQALVNLCSVAPNDPLADEARTACYSYLAGVVDFYRALTRRDAGIAPFVCPGRELTRRELAIVLVDWAAVHPEHLNELPVEGVMRAAVDAFPCEPEGGQP